VKLLVHTKLRSLHRACPPRCLVCPLLRERDQLVAELEAAAGKVADAFVAGVERGKMDADGKERAR
jgi:hypothetical protein